MTDPSIDPRPESPTKVDPEELTLRARPQAITRINRKVLLAVATLGSILIFGALMVALDPPSFRSGRTSEELYNVDNKPTPDELATLPRDYGDLPPPQLGAPLPGDLGGAVLKTEQERGIAEPLPMPQGSMGFRPDPLEDALRAERLRLERQRQQARESAVFFQVTARRPAPATSRQTAADSEGAAPSDEAAAPPSPGIDLQRDQGLQRQKQDFLGRLSDGDIYSRHPLQTPLSPYQLMAGTVISGTLLTGINSDLPGQVIAQVTENVYDTVTGQYLLIPQGARLIGKYDSLIAFGQERALVVWTRLVNPDGSSVVLDNLPAADRAGHAGLEDEVDFHTWSLIKGIALATLLGVSTELAFDDQESDLVRALRESAQNNANQAGQQIVQRYLNIQPTITVRPGWPLRIIVNKDIILRPYRG